MQRTDAQIAASRVNGSRSRGPVTTAGKAKSALNATKHGLWSRQVVLSTEDAGAYAEFKARLTETLGATTAADCEMVEQLAAAHWRLDRIRNLETALLNEEIDRLEKENNGRDEVGHSGETDPLRLTAEAFRNLHDDGILRHIHRQEASLRRMVEKLTAECAALLDGQSASQKTVETNPPALLTPQMYIPQEWRNEPTPAAQKPKQHQPKRPTYDKNGRRIHYPDKGLAA